MVTATGNNLTLCGDMTRRSLLCRLDPGCERPELLTFASEPAALVKQHRWTYLVAALTILRAYHIAGRPQQPARLGSFAEWSDWVRGALIWLGEADPVASMETIRSTDPNLEALSTVLAQWKAVIGSRRVTARVIIDRATAARAPGPLAGLKHEFTHPELREALLVVAGDGGAISGRRLGRWLSAQENRMVEGLSIKRGGKTEGSTFWALHDATEVARHEP